MKPLKPARAQIYQYIDTDLKTALYFILLFTKQLKEDNTHFFSSAK